MNCCCNVKGFIVGISDGKATVKAEDGNTYENVLLINPIGTNTIPQITNNTAVLLFKSLGSSNATLGIAYNYIQQSTKLGVKNVGDYTVGSLVGNNNIKFQANGNTVETATNKTIVANTNVNGEFTTNGITNLGDAIANVLNENTIIRDSLGGLCVVQEAGQDKVKA